MKVLVNADDFGWDENRTKAICEAFARHLVTSTTAMTNMPWFERAMALAREKGFLKDVGLHFCITEGTPLTDEMRNCRVFCDEEGVFTKCFHNRLKTRLMLSRAAKDAIAAEAKAQIERYLDCGGTLMHLDSHHHSHTDFAVATTLLPLAKKYGFKSCRMSRTLTSGRSGAVKRLYKTLFNAYAGGLLPFRVDEFTDFADFPQFYRQLPANRRVEVMVHPLYRTAAGDLDLSGTYMDTRRPMSELEAFWRTAADEGVSLVGYDELG